MHDIFIPETLLVALFMSGSKPWPYYSGCDDNNCLDKIGGLKQVSHSIFKGIYYVNLEENNGRPGQLRLWKYRRHGCL